MARGRNREYLLVDGYNIIFAWDNLKKQAHLSLEDARKKLLDILSDYQGFSGYKIIVVFDAHNVKDSIGSIEKYDSLTTVYTKENESADNYIERLASILSKDYRVRVATSDSLEQVIIMGRGASRLSALDLYEEVKASKKNQRTDYIEKRPIKKNMLLDNLNKDLRDKLEKMIMQEEKKRD